MPRPKSKANRIQTRGKIDANQNPNNLPAPITRLIGRGREIARVKRLLASARLVTLTGPGGCGKTRLALAVAHRLKPSIFPQGIWFIDLAGLDTPGLIPQVIATTLGISEAHHRPLLETIANFLQHKKALFILDNCEHLMPACAVPIRTMLDRCPQLRVLATSREPLGLADEMIWLVPSLTLPDLNPPRQFAERTKSDAIQLFAARAKTALPEFNLDETNAAAVEQICRRLDGIPLAIELAAARIKMLDAAQIAERLEDSMQLLTRGNPTAAPRHQTMRAALDWSFALLLPSEQQLFQRLSVFADGFTLKAIEMVCAEMDSRPTQQAIRPADVLDLLSNLVDKSLVLVVDREPEHDVRYRLLEPVRQYALMRLRETGQETRARERHLDYFIRLAEETVPHIKSTQQVLWLKRLEKEHDNFRSALAWSTHDDVRALAGMRLAAALHQFWHRRGYWSEGRRWLAGAIANYDAHRDTAQPAGDLYLARAIVAEGWLAYHQGDYGDTPEQLERGLLLAQSLNDRVTMALAQGVLAQLSSYAGNYDAAISLSEAGVTNALRSNERWSSAWAWLIYGMIQYRRDEAGARISLDRSADIFRELGDKRFIAATLNVKGYITANAGELDTARDLFEQALAIGFELGDKDLQLKEQSNLASLAQLQNDTPRAAELHERVLGQARDLGLKEVIAGSLIGLGHIRIMQGDLFTASQDLRESLKLAQDIGMNAKLAMALAGLARIAAAQGHSGPAAQALGAIEAYLALNSLRPDADEHNQLEEDRAAVRVTMTTEAFAGNFGIGQTLSLEQAADALTALDVESGQPLTTSITTGGRLHLRALGPTRVTLDERMVTEWQYARVKELLFYLASHAGRTKAQIGLALWSDASPAQLRNSLGTGLYHLRRALANPDWIVFEKDEYRFNRALDYRFDVEQYESNLEQAARVQVTAPDRAVELFEQALRLYTGDFVEDFLEGEWFLLRREELRRKFLDAWLALGRLHLARQDYERAAQAFRRAIDKDNLLEQAHRELMRTYARAGERGLAIRQYQMLEQVMRDELHSPPAPESVALFESLRRGQAI